MPFSWIINSLFLSSNSHCRDPLQSPPIHCCALKPGQFLPPFCERQLAAMVRFRKAKGHRCQKGPNLRGPIGCTSKERKNWNLLRHNTFLWPLMCHCAAIPCVGRAFFSFCLERVRREFRQFNFVGLEINAPAGQWCKLKTAAEAALFGFQLAHA